MRKGRIIHLAFLIALGSLAPGRIPAQADSIRLDEVEIVSNRIPGGQDRAIPGLRTRIWDLDSVVSGGEYSLSGLLERESGIHLKHYGPGSSVTTSIRGASASQSLILWNGIPIGNPMLGQSDLSLVSLTAADAAELTAGGQSALWGSGAMGGLISLYSLPKFQRGLSLEAAGSIGSFGRRDASGEAAWSGERLTSSTRLLYREADNDYPIRAAGVKGKRQTHAHYRTSALFQDLHWRAGRNDMLSLHAWYQAYDRDIPPTSTQNRSGAGQEDELLRLVGRWKRNGGLADMQTTIGMSRESLRYSDPLVKEYSDSRISTVSMEWSASRTLLTGGTVEAGFHFDHKLAETDAYSIRARQWTMSGFASWRGSAGAFTWQLSGRSGWVDGEPQPLTGAAGLDWAPADWLTIRGHIARTFRLPTLNDLYWEPGGNPDLKPESGWGQSLGVEIGQTATPVHWSFSVTAFHRRIRNYILWGLTENDLFWSPSNVGRVRSYGLEGHGRIRWRALGTSWRLEGGYTGLRSFSEQDIALPAITEGEQLFYIPEHTVHSSAGIAFSSLAVTYRHRYTSSRSTFSEPVDSYDIGSLAIRYRVRSASPAVQVYARVENIWDRSYRIVERRPMPGRHFLLGCRFRIRPEFHSNKNNEP